MNSLYARLGRHYLLAATLLLLSGCVVGERHETTVERRWPAAGIETVKVEGIDGNLSVVSGRPDEVVLVARIRSRGIEREAGQENSGYFQTAVTGGTLRIGQKKSRIQVRFPFASHTRLEIDYSLRVPESVALDLNTVNGKIATRGVAGQTQMTIVNGAIDAEVGGEKDFKASTVNGEIRAKFLRDFKGARLRTVNGGVAAVLPPSASFRCNLSQVNGDFEASFPLSIHSNPGSRRVSGEVNGGDYQLQISTINGDVHVESMAMPVAPDAPPIPPLPPAPALAPGR